MIRSTLSRRAEIALYASAAVSYITTGLFYKGVLNWIVGPLWLVVWVETGSRLATAVADRRARRSAAGGAR